MPGIAGLVTRMPRARAEAELARMVSSMAHEPFYETGTWVDEAHGVYVGWCVRKGAMFNGLPLRNAQGDVVLVFVGEEFPDPDLAARFRGDTQSEGASASYLVNQYEDDTRFPAALNGRFHGVLLDRTRGVAVLFNDRYGLQRVYHHATKEAFYFAGEAKAILAVRPELRRPNVAALGELVSLGCVLDNKTIFDGIGVLPCASKWTFRAGTLDRKESYFEPREWEEQPVLDDEQYYRELRDVFERNLPRYFSGVGPVGISLTGGLDTRMIMAWHKPAPGSLPCYTFGGSYRDSRDVVVARQVASACGQSHDVIPVGKDFLARFAHYAERTVYLTDGCADLSRTADLYVNELAREIAPVRMTGNYGGEVLRRVRAFKPVQPLPGLFAPAFLSHIRTASDAYARTIDVHPLSFAVFRQAPWHHYGLLALEQTQLALRTPYLDNDLIRTIYRAPVSATTSDSSCLRLIEEGSARLSAVPTDRGFGMRGLRGVAARAVHEFSFKAEYAYDYGMPQWVARFDHRLSALGLERVFLGRHKFYHYRVWYRDALGSYVREMLLDPKSLARPYVERKRVESVVNGHLRGDENHTLAIHKLLTLELVHRLFLDSPAKDPVDRRDSAAQTVNA
jgi:asparagine synthase (glutamine-hydrolysing)